jgi:hypothetical protein
MLSMNKKKRPPKRRAGYTLPPSVKDWLALTAKNKGWSMNQVVEGALIIYRCSSDALRKAAVVDGRPDVLKSLLGAVARPANEDPESVEGDSVYLRAREGEKRGRKGNRQTDEGAA